MWECVKHEQDALSPPPRFGHTLTALSSNEVACFGGMGKAQHLAALASSFASLRRHSSTSSAFITQNDATRASPPPPQAPLVTNASFVSATEDDYFCDMHVFDVTERKWNGGTRLRSAYAAAQAAVSPDGSTGGQELGEEEDEDEEDDTPPPRCHHTAVAVSPALGAMCAEACSLSLASLSSTPLMAPRPAPTGNPPNAPPRAWLCIFGGCARRPTRGDVWIVNCDSGRCFRADDGTQTSAVARYCHSAVVHNEGMFVFGGKSGGSTSGTRHNDLIRFSFRDRQWLAVSDIGERPRPRACHSAVVCNESMYIIGGNNGAEFLGDAFEFNFRHNMWRKFNGFGDSAPSNRLLSLRTRHSASVCADGQTMVVFGGSVNIDERSHSIQHQTKTSALVVTDFATVFAANDASEMAHDADTDPLRMCPPPGVEVFRSEDPANLRFSNEPPAQSNATMNSSMEPQRRELHAAAVVGDTFVIWGGRLRGALLEDVYVLRNHPQIRTATLQGFLRNWICDHFTMAEINAMKSTTSTAMQANGGGDSLLHRGSRGGESSGSSAIVLPTHLCERLKSWKRHRCYPDLDAAASS